VSWPALDSAAHGAVDGTRGAPARRIIMRTLTIAVICVITCASAGADPGTITVSKGNLVEGMKCLTDPTQTYTLYLPTSYTTEKKWPVLLVFDPRGRSVPAAEVFRGAAEKWGWVILSSNDTRSDGSMEPNLKALNALWPEVHNRYAADENRLYAAGLSGGGHVAYLLGKQTGELAGIIATGSRLLADHLQDTSFAVFASAGSRDFNYLEMRAVDELVAEEGSPHRFHVFDGLHEWMPPESGSDAVAWMELIAMQRSLRPRDDAVISELMTRDMAVARTLEEGGDVLGAMRQLEMVGRTYDGLAEIDDVAQSVQRLAGSREVKKARKEEKKWLAIERRTRQRFTDTYTRLRREDEPMTSDELRDALGVGRLQTNATRPGLEGEISRRLLSTLFSEASYYAAYQLMQAERWEAAAALLTIATEVYDGWGELWPSWYNLACVNARARRRGEALRALDRAVAGGFTNVEHLRTDPDLESLRDMDEFQKILCELER